MSRFVGELTTRHVELPGLFGVFYYRSANPRTLAALREFLPVPVEALTKEFAGGATPDGICARSLRALRTRRPALLHQQPAARPRVTSARRHSPARGADGDAGRHCSAVTGNTMRFPVPRISCSAAYDRGTMVTSNPPPHARARARSCTTDAKSTHSTSACAPFAVTARS